MDFTFLQDSYELLLKGFWVTLRVFLASGLIALVLGTFVAVARVSPVPAMRAVGTAYVTLFRNTPLLLLLFITYYGLPAMGIDFGFFWNVSMAAGLYTAAFVCEALRSGINGVPLGQAEAARAVGMPFSMTMTQVILPQAFRLVVPPIASVFIALAKNTSLVAALGLADLAFRLQGLLRDYPSSRTAAFLTIAAMYIVIVAAISALASWAERRWKVESR
ncbi:amino acid ABC transporter permease [Aeromicrobium duanguangcaii]|uniref:Amino acid ABC transporter permease n=1 Tax=Aeromicrobium duanguangcaii TaxID=2968086 RepID=A0ABY5KAT9_9ACTN|nr:amino acid ABC transporter permease [Aeromicrobium duanguangcaii]UUI67430.1 amino acid ABC transporter permease [Aeromicrobium duanguangcaii]